MSDPAITVAVQTLQPLPQQSPAHPWTFEDQRQRMMLAAGFDEPKRVELLKRAVERLEELLDATETTFYAYKGQVLDERTVKALGVQLSAIRQTLELLGMRASLTSQGKGGGPSVVVNVGVAQSVKDLGTP